jgi:hypothetical protein
MTDTEINTYFNDNPTVVNLTGTIEEQHKQIITQKYIAWVGNGIEAYNDFRRTGYPPLALSLNATGDDPNTIRKDSLIQTRKDKEILINQIPVPEQTRKFGGASEKPY